MKNRGKTLWIILLAALLVYGCGGSEAAPTPASEPPAPTAAPTPTPVPTPAPAAFTDLALGETLTAEGIELTLDRAETLGAVCAVRGGMGVSRNAPEGKRFLAVTGRVKNTGPREFDAANLVGEITADGQYAYPLEVFVIQDLSFNPLVQPLAEARIVLYASLPVELADSLTECTLTFGFEDGFASMPVSAEASAHPCRLALSNRPEAANLLEVRPFVLTELALKEPVVTDFAEITFTDVKVSNRLTKKFRGNTYSMYTDPAMRVLFLEGTIKNTSPGSIVPCITGTVTVNGYEYELRSWTVVKGTAVVPLQEVPILVYAQMPPELLKGSFACQFCFGFNEDFANNPYTALTGCRYAWSLDWER